MIKKIFPFLLTMIVFTVMFTACKQYVDVGEPRTQLTGAAIFNNNTTATAAILAVYNQMENDGMAYNLILATGTGADELNNHRTTADAVAVASNSLTPENGTITSIWNKFYQYIYHANAVIAGLESSTTVTIDLRDQLRGEALFIRGYCHYYLGALYENIPYVKSIDPLVNSTLPQLNSQQVYAAAITDLLEGKSLLASHYVNASNTAGGERIRPNRFAATALLARLYLYSGKWLEAEQQATEVINAVSLYSLPASLNAVFLKNSTEAIWQLQAVQPKFNSFAGGYLNATSVNPNIVSLTKNLVDSFETGDLRKVNWTQQTNGTQLHHWLYKFKVGQNAPAITEYTMLLRLGELFLIRSEARARQSKFPEANADLNSIRQRAGLPALSVTEKDELLTRIARERRLELFGECGDRWLDLRRTGKIDEILQPRKGVNWASTDAVYPIPLNEMLRHPGMNQNAGY